MHFRTISPDLAAKYEPEMRMDGSNGRVSPESRNSDVGGGAVDTLSAVVWYKGPMSLLNLEL